MDSHLNHMCIIRILHVPFLTRLDSSNVQNGEHPRQDRQQTSEHPVHCGEGGRVAVAMVRAPDCKPDDGGDTCDEWEHNVANESDFVALQLVQEYQADS